MKEMKLRYWDKDTKKMYDDSHFVYWNNNFYFREDSSKIDGILSGKRKGIVGYSILEDNIMQSTGLCDKHGKEIFEGDIVANNLGMKEVVTFGKYAIMDVEDDMTEYVGFNIVSGYGYPDVQPEEYEIIGHKYMDEFKDKFE